MKKWVKILLLIVSIVVPVVVVVIFIIFRKRYGICPLGSTYSNGICIADPSPNSAQYPILGSNPSPYAVFQSQNTLNWSPITIGANINLLYHADGISIQAIPASSILNQIQNSTMYPNITTTTIAGLVLTDDTGPDPDTILFASVNQQSNYTGITVPINISFENFTPFGQPILIATPLEIHANYNGDDYVLCFYSYWAGSGGIMGTNYPLDFSSAFRDFSCAFVRNNGGENQTWLSKYKLGVWPVRQNDGLGFQLPIVLIGDGQNPSITTMYQTYTNPDSSPSCAPNDTMLGYSQCNPSTPPVPGRYSCPTPEYVQIGSSPTCALSSGYPVSCSVWTDAPAIADLMSFGCNDMNPDHHLGDYNDIYDNDYEGNIALCKGSNPQVYNNLQYVEPSINVFGVAPSNGIQNKPEMMIKTLMIDWAITGSISNGVTPQNFMTFIGATPTLPNTSVCYTKNVNPTNTCWSSWATSPPGIASNCYVDSGGNTITGKTGFQAYPTATSPYPSSAESMRCACGNYNFCNSSCLNGLTKTIKDDKGNQFVYFDPTPLTNGFVIQQT